MKSRGQGVDRYANNGSKADQQIGGSYRRGDLQVAAGMAEGRTAHDPHGHAADGADCQRVNRRNFRD